ncbi:hypothetical protein AUP68_12229 [Ilyonectria robusta]
MAGDYVSGFWTVPRTSHPTLESFQLFARVIVDTSLAWGYINTVSTPYTPCKRTPIDTKILSSLRQRSSNVQSKEYRYRCSGGRRGFSDGGHARPCLPATTAGTCTVTNSTYLGPDHQAPAPGTRSFVNQPTSLSPTPPSPPRPSLETATARPPAPSRLQPAPFKAACPLRLALRHRDRLD